MTTIKKVSYALVASSALLAAVLLVPGSASAAIYNQLQVGSRGSEVTQLQIFLAANPAVYPQGLVTGYFGPLTKAAVMRFQANNGISTVGRVGPLTLAAINAQMQGNVYGNTTGDKSAPAIYGVGVTTSNSSATLGWLTNENAASVIYYSTYPLALSEESPTTGISVSGTSAVVNIPLQTVHGITLSNLSPNTTYYYLVYVRDAVGNVSVTWPSSFRTN